jgi:hypothetical protein
MVRSTERKGAAREEIDEEEEEDGENGEKVSEVQNSQSSIQFKAQLGQKRRGEPSKPPSVTRGISMVCR